MTPDPTMLSPALFNSVGVVGVVVLVGLLIFYGALVPGRTHRAALSGLELQLEKAEERADRWEGVALMALQATERLAEPVETAAKVLTKLPNPAARDRTGP